MHKVKVRPNSLKAFIADELMVKKIISYPELKKLATEYGSKESNAERRLRNGDAWDLPVEKLNKNKKPIKQGEAIMFYRWVGGKTVFK